ncbi:hypothetical protein SynA18461_00489 [Synechococcus sp. A18-46.1]|nr:hypothetical protein SynA18461_00489 [Synechococcus sp. A18-46.1]
MPGDEKWDNIVKSNGFPLLDSSSVPLFDLLGDFRSNLIYIDDIFPPKRQWYSFLHKFSPAYRIVLNELTSSYKRLLFEFSDSLIFPLNLDSTPGSPRFINYDSRSLNLRWLRYIWFYNRLLSSSIDTNLLFNGYCLDIGGAYGAFSSLIKSAFPQSSHIILDFPVQLGLARYYLGSLFPDAKFFIPPLNESYVLPCSSEFDFVLIPTSSFPFLDKFSVTSNISLSTNFLSFGEMPQSIYTNYINHPVWQSADYLYNVNCHCSRQLSDGVYDSDFNLLEYLELTKSFSTIYFGDFRLYNTFYNSRRLFPRIVPKPNSYFEILQSRSSS